MSEEHMVESDMQPRRRLGRGLSSLLGRGTQGGEEMQTGDTSSLQLLPVEGMERNPWQPRKDFDADSMRELADSIREHGVLQPILVRELPEGGFQLIAGERRWQAARQAGLDSIPCRVVDVIDKTACEFALEENLKRKDLNDLEKAKAFKQYMDQFESSLDELARQLSMSRPAISNILRLLELSEPVQAALHQGKVTAGHARALLKLDEAGQIEMCGRIQAEQLSVRDTEAATRQRLATGTDSAVPQEGDAQVLPMKPAKPQLTNHLKALQEHLRGLLGVQVEFKLATDEKGQIVIPFDSKDEFETVLRKLRRAAA